MAKQKREKLGTVEIYDGRAQAVMIREADPETGLTVTHLKRKDFLDVWVEKDRITEAQWQVAQDFHANLHRSGCGERYKTIFEMTNTNAKGGASSTEDMLFHFDARQYIRVSMNALGPKQGDAMWHVVGLEWSLNRYVQEKRLAGQPCTRDSVSGLIEGALETLAKLHVRAADRQRMASA